MDHKKSLVELNKILTLEHGHLGMYENYMTYNNKEIRRTMRRFMELEMEHINKIQSIIKNLGEKPSLIVESGDIIGYFFGITINLTDTHKALKAFNFIEEKSHQGYREFLSKLDQQSKDIYAFIAEIVYANQLESHFQHLWLQDKLNQFL